MSKYFGMIAFSCLLSSCMKDEDDSGGPPMPLELLNKHSSYYPYRVQEVLRNKWFKFDSVYCADSAVADSLSRQQALDSMYLEWTPSYSNRIQTTYRRAIVIGHDENNGYDRSVEYHLWGLKKMCLDPIVTFNSQ